MSVNAKYQDFDYDDYEEYEDFEDDDEKEFSFKINPVLSTIANWVIIIGMVIAVILLVYFVVNGKVFTAFMFTIGLIVAYFFGYLFMFCLDKLTINND